MATATKPSAPVPPSPRPGASAAPAPGTLRRVLDGTYRFLASLKLAVISLLTLSAVLAYGTFFESKYGTSAVQDVIYRSTPFALLLAVLGVNILCAATIRFPWKRRQIGFVITHLGLLILLAGSFLSKQYAEEGQVGYLEGEEHDVVMAQPDSAILRLRRLDPGTGKLDKEYEIPFQPGPFAWGPDRVEDLSHDGEPFRVKLTGFLPASARRFLHEPAATGSEGVPMLQLSAMARPPGSPREFDLFAMRQEDPSGRMRWLVARNEFGRVVRDVKPARFVFQFAETPDLLDDFLHPPADPNTQRLARLHYVDKQGKERVFDWPVDDKPRTETLPDSDLTATFVRTDTYPDANRAIGRDTGESTFPVVHFKVQKGSGPSQGVEGFSTLPAMAKFMAERVGQTGTPLLRVGYFTPPLEADIAESRKPGVNPMSLTRGVIEILGTPDGKLYRRVFALDGMRVAPGPFRPEEDVAAFGGEGRAMSLTFRVDHYLPSGKEVQTCVPVNLPPNEVDNGFKAVRVALTVKGENREFWVRRTGEFEPAFGREGAGPVLFKDAAYDVAYDLVRKPLGFRMKLEDFQSDTDPGSSKRSSYISTVLINDPEKGIEDERRKIWMNNPMNHRGYAFYQSNFTPIEDANEQPTGQFRSVFQVRYDPAWQVMYAGSYLVILGAFIQFYMRSGIFSFRKAGAASGETSRSTPPDEPL